MSQKEGQSVLPHKNPTFLSESNMAPLPKPPRTCFPITLVPIIIIIIQNTFHLMEAFPIIRSYFNMFRPANCVSNLQYIYHIYIYNTYIIYDILYIFFSKRSYPQIHTTLHYKPQFHLPELNQRLRCFFVRLGRKNWDPF